eukprot:13332584-Alexandrium_andersonii.AAC.1
MCALVVHNRPMPRTSERAQLVKHRKWLPTAITHQLSRRVAMRAIALSTDKHDGPDVLEHTAQPGVGKRETHPSAHEGPDVLEQTAQPGVGKREHTHLRLPGPRGLKDCVRPVVGHSLSA